MTFVGRRDQLALLDDALRTPQTRLVLIGGDAGMGKTRLLDQFAGRVADGGVRVLRTSCVELGAAGLPLAPVAAALRQLIDLVGLDDLVGAQPGCRALLGLLPEYGASPTGPVPDLFGALLHRLGTEHPLVWIVDDLHWADRSTRELLGYLARTLRSTQVLVVAAYRTDDLDRRHPLRAFLAELQRLPSVRRTELPGLSRAEVAQLVTGSSQAAGALTEGSGAEQVYARSGGNPLFALELARSGIGSLRDLLLRRISALDPPVQELVRRAAVGGREVPHKLLEAMVPLVLGSLRVAVDAQILVPSGEGYSFRHALVRDAVLDDLLPAERRELHRSFAVALDADPGLVAVDRLAAELAYHWYESGDAARALPALLAAAESAARVSAYPEQAQLLSRALRLQPDLALSEQAITAAVWASDNLLALGLADRALESASASAEPVRIAKIHAHRAMALHNLGRDGALVAVDEALAALGPSGSPAERAELLDYLASMLILRGQFARAEELAGEAVRLSAGTELEVSARSTLGWSLSQRGEYAEAVAMLRSAPPLAASGWGLTRAQLNLAKALDETGAYAEALEVAAAGLRTAESAGVLHALGPLFCIVRASSLLSLGEWSSAEHFALRGLELDGVAVSAAMLHGLLAEVALGRGDLDAARDELAAADLVAGSPGELALWTLQPSCQRAWLALAENRLADARRIVEESLPLAIECGAQWQVWLLRCLAARLGVVVPGDLRDDSPVLAAYASWYAAETGTGLWTDAVAAWDELGRHYRAADARVRAAEAALSSGDRGAALALLERALSQASSLGASALVSEIEVLARSSRLEIGVAPAGPTAAGLTERETEVLRLVAAGRSNKQIASELFISAKTVSVHVSNVLAKFGVRTRGEAAATAHRLGLFD